MIYSQSITEKGSLWYLNFKATGTDWDVLKDGVKAIPGRQFNPALKAWTVPACDVSATALELLGFTVPHKVEKKPLKLHPNLDEWKDLHIPDVLDPRLFPEQVEDLRFFKWANGRAVLVGEVG